MSGRVRIDSAIMAIERPSDVVQRRPAAQPVELNVAFLEACQSPLLARASLSRVCARWRRDRRISNLTEVYGA